MRGYGRSHTCNTASYYQNLFGLSGFAFQEVKVIAEFLRIDGTAVDLMHLRNVNPLQRPREAFEAALNEAKATAADESLSVDEQNQVTEAVNRLSEAVNNLKKADGSAANLSVNGDGSITGGSGSAKTGEATPIAMAMAALLLAGAVVFSKKKRS